MIHPLPSLRTIDDSSALMLYNVPSNLTSSCEIKEILLLINPSRSDMFKIDYCNIYSLKYNVSICKLRKKS